MRRDAADLVGRLPLLTGVALHAAKRGPGGRLKLRHVALSLHRSLEKGRDFGQLDLLGLRTAQDIEEVLGVQQLLGNDRVGLTERTDAECARIRLHHVDDPKNLSVHRGATVEPEIIDMNADEVELGLEIVPESEDLGAALLLPLVGDLAQLFGIKTAVLELCIQIIVHGACKNILKFAIHETLLTGVHRYSQIARALLRIARLAVNFRFQTIARL